MADFKLIRDDGRDQPAVSYSTLRRLIGVLGLVLPVFVVFGGYVVEQLPLRSSISAYYYTNMHDWFVGLLLLVGFFLLTYDAYPGLDRTLSVVSGVCAIGIVCFPTEAPANLGSRVGIFGLPDGFTSRFHYAFAASLFVSLAVMSLFLFTRSNKGASKGAAKRKRNLVFVICGIAMLVALGAGLAHVVIVGPHDDSPFILCVEAICLTAFGISWLTKGEAFFPDAEAATPVQEAALPQGPA